MRVSQADRDRVVDALRGHAGDGRLEVEELEQRVEAALAARTKGELDKPLRDLPSPPRRTRRRRRVAPAIVLLAIAAAAAVVFAETGAAGWVMWAALGWALFSFKRGRYTCVNPGRRRHSAA